MFAESSIHTREFLFGDDYSSKICIAIAHHHLLTIPILPAFCIFILSRPITAAQASTSIRLMTAQHFQIDKCLREESNTTDTSARESLNNKQGISLSDGHYQLSAPMAFYEVRFPKQDVWKWKIKYPLGWSQSRSGHHQSLGLVRCPAWHYTLNVSPSEMREKSEQKQCCSSSPSVQDKAGPGRLLVK